MSGQDDPWQVDGVSAATRLAAEAAAARDGLTLGAWIDAAIRNAPAAPERAVPVSGDDILAALDVLAHRIDAAEAATHRAIAPLRERLALLSQQLAEIEAATAAGDGKAAGSASDPAG
jgi:hypothetical protein